MDFHLVSSTLLKEFDENGIQYAIIGGFALGLWEVTRATIDMDFLLLIDDLPQAESILAKFSYRPTRKSENVVQYVSDLAPYGQINILIAFRKISRNMLKRRVPKALGSDLQTYTLPPRRSHRTKASSNGQRSQQNRSRKRRYLGLTQSSQEQGTNH